MRARFRSKRRDDDEERTAMRCAGRAGRCAGSSRQARDATRNQCRATPRGCARPEPTAADPASRPPTDRTPLAEPKGPHRPEEHRSSRPGGATLRRADRAKAASPKRASCGAMPRRAAASQSSFSAIADHLEIGELGEPEGAAGSIYMTMPVIFYGETRPAVPRAGRRHPAAGQRCAGLDRRRSGAGTSSGSSGRSA